MSAFIAAAPGWVAQVGTGAYRSVIGFDAESGEPVVVERPDLAPAGEVEAVFYDPSKVPGPPS